MKSTIIPAHAGETYNYGFDATGWVAADDSIDEVSSVLQVAKSSEDAPDAIIGAYAVTEAIAVAEITVPEDAPVGTRYTFHARVNTVRGGLNIRLMGILEVIE